MRKHTPPATRRPYHAPSRLRSKQAHVFVDMHMLPEAARERLRAVSRLGNPGDPVYEAKLEREINNVKYDYPEYFRGVPSKRIK